MFIQKSTDNDHFVEFKNLWKLQYAILQKQSLGSLLKSCCPEKFLKISGLETYLIKLQAVDLKFYWNNSPALVLPATFLKCFRNSNFLENVWTTASEFPQLITQVIMRSSKINVKVLKLIYHNDNAFQRESYSETWKKTKKKKTAADMRHFLITQTKLSGLWYSNKSLSDYFLMNRKSCKS